MRNSFPCLLVLLITILWLTSCASSQAQDEPGVFQPVELGPEVTIQEIQSGYRSTIYTVTQVVQFYLDRIESIDQSGPELRAVLTVNPEALAIATQLDEDLAQGKWRGPLHGIPVLLKDNINTADSMPTTAGARVLAESFPPADSPIARKLREAGAVILGKANLSEWANFHSLQSSSGWSALGGQTKNPYRLGHNPCGSSAGSGVAVAANLCVVAIGTETNGSIVCPSNNNGVVGIKPTVGLISQEGIVPISSHQDTGGPMARTVTDAATTLGVLTSKNTPATTSTVPRGRKIQADYTQFLRPGGLRGKRIGYYTQPLDGDTTALGGVMASALATLRQEGATIVEVDQILPQGTEDASFLVLLYEFKAGLNQYLRDLGEAAPVHNLAEIIELTFADSTEMEYHDHQLLKMAQERGGLESAEYVRALAQIMQAARTDGIDRVMDAQELDAIVAPTGSPAWVTSLENGDTFGVFSSSPAAIAGYPNISVPMGQIDGLPVGMSIFGRAWSEALLIQMAYNFEQATQARFTPKYLED